MAEAIIHRKQAGQPKCICGSKMKMVKGCNWVCLKQERRNEPSRIKLPCVKE